mmetsp:Transcript_118044/g.176368  ORF Transcript_118044/g.176368 Transcript_118044/m.176368 type:complete len:324 (+) Transcript_118044:870-1841(+)
MSTSNKYISLDNLVDVKGNRAVGLLYKGEFFVRLLHMELCGGCKYEFPCLENLKIWRAPHQFLFHVISFFYFKIPRWALRKFRGFTHDNALQHEGSLSRAHPVQHILEVSSVSSLRGNREFVGSDLFALRDVCQRFVYVSKASFAHPAQKRCEHCRSSPFSRQAVNHCDIAFIRLHPIFHTNQKFEQQTQRGRRRTRERESQDLIIEYRHIIIYFAQIPNKEASVVSSLQQMPHGRKFSFGRHGRDDTAGHRRMTHRNYPISNVNHLGVPKGINIQRQSWIPFVETFLPQKVLFQARPFHVHGFFGCFHSPPGTFYNRRPAHL